MKRPIALLLLMFAPFILTSNIAVGADALNHDEVVKLLQGNTAEGVNTKWDKKMIWYFQEGGTVRKQNQAGKRGRANWHVDKKGQLCYQDKHDNDEKCEPVVPRGDGGYDAMDGRWRFDKILPGNAHNL